METFESDGRGGDSAATVPVKQSAMQDAVAGDAVLILKKRSEQCHGIVVQRGRKRYETLSRENVSKF